MKKRCWVVLLAVLLIAGLLPFAAYAGPSTTVPSGYTGIYSKSELDGIRSNPSGKFILMADISFTDQDFSSSGAFYNSGKFWTPIGTSSAPFTGVFNGNRHTISGLRVKTDSTVPAGLFGTTANAEIRDLALLKVNIESGTSAGGVVGFSQGGLTISNCVVTGTVSGSYTGGIVGKMAPLYSKQYNFVQTISSCRNDATITSTAWGGGIVGSYDKGVSYSGSYSSHAESHFINCCNNGSVTSRTISGGIVGRFLGVYYTTGGGSLIATSDITDCCNTGKLTGTDSDQLTVGGIVGNGQNSLKLTRCYNTGSITWTSARLSNNIGPIFGGSVGTLAITDCYYLNGCVTGATSVGGTALSSSQFASASSFQNWDFTQTWAISGSRPALRALNLSGTPRITGDLVYNAVLGIDASDVTGMSGSTEISWYIGASTNPVSHEKQYQVKASDIGKAVRLVLKNSDPFCPGELRVNSTLIRKAPQPASPDLAALSELSWNSLSFEPAADQEYSLDGQSWRDEGTFTDLLPNHAYTLYTRLKETDTYLAGASTACFTATTDCQPLGGQLEITGDAVFGMPLTADTARLEPADAEYTLEWLCGENVVGQGTQYIPAAANLDAQLRVRAVGSGDYGGSVLSEPVTVGRCDITAASAAALASQTYQITEIRPVPTLTLGEYTLVYGQDYTAVYDRNILPGTAAVLLQGIGCFRGELELSFEIEKANLSLVDITPPDPVLYTGQALQPKPLLVYQGEALKEGTDYTLSWSDNTNAGLASITVSGVGNYTGERSVSFTILGTSIDNAEVLLEQTQFAYTGSELRPVPTVMLGGKTLTANTDYTVAYRNNQREGTATVVVTGVGNYTGSASAEFTISGHIYGDWITERAPGCTAPGLRYRLCSGCDDRIEEEIPALKHSFGDWAPSTTTVHRRICTRCGAVETEAHTGCFSYCPVCGRDDTAVTLSCDLLKGCPVGAVQGAKIFAACYGADGKLLAFSDVATASVRLANVEQAASVKVFFLDAASAPLRPELCFSHTPGTLHRYSSTVTKAATCLAAGVRTWTCADCGMQYTEPIEKLPHTPVEDAAVDPDCTHTGLTAGSHCAVCEQILIAQQTIPAKGHDWMPATCQKPKTCSVCGATEGAPLDSHSFSGGLCRDCGAKQPVTSLQIRPASLTLALNATASLRASIEPAAATQWDVYWSSDTPSVASVDKNGTVRGLYPGTAVISCVCGGQSASCTVTVTGTAGAATYYFLTNLALTYPNNVENGNYYYIMYTDKGSVAIISDTTHDTLTIGYMQSGTSTSTSMITFGSSLSKPYIGTFTFTNSSGSKLTGRANAYPSSFGENGGPSFYSWSGTSSNKQTAQDLYNSGIMLALLQTESKLLLRTRYSVRDLGFTDSAFVDKPDPIDQQILNLHLDANDLVLRAGEKQNLACTLVPSVSGVTPVWYSSNDRVVSVENGLVCALREGYATVYVSAGGKLAACTVTVVNAVPTAPVEQIVLSQSSASLLSGDTLELEAVLSPDEAFGTPVAWSSSNSAVATVDGDGVVRAVSSGTATITATAGDCSAKCTVKVVRAPFSSNAAHNCMASYVLRNGSPAGSSSFVFTDVMTISGNPQYYTATYDTDTGDLILAYESFSGSFSLSKTTLTIPSSMETPYWMSLYAAGDYMGRSKINPATFKESDDSSITAILLRTQNLMLVLNGYSLRDIGFTAMS